MTDNVVPLKSTKGRDLCPECKKPVDEKFKPFCSKRCSDLDLGRWSNESYSIKGRPLGEED